MDYSTDLNVRSQTIELLKENTVVNLCDLGLGNGFLDRTWKLQASKRKKIDKWDLIKIKNLR